MSHVSRYGTTKRLLKQKSIVWKDDKRCHHSCYFNMSDNDHSRHNMVSNISVDRGSIKFKFMKI